MSPIELSWTANKTVKQAQLVQHWVPKIWTPKSSMLLKAKSLFDFFLQILCSACILANVAIFCDYLCLVYECVFPSPVSPRQPLDRHCPAFLLIQFSIIKWFVFVFLFVFLYSCGCISICVFVFVHLYFFFCSWIYICIWTGIVPPFP